MEGEDLAVVAAEGGGEEEEEKEEVGFENEKKNRSRNGG